MSKTKTKRMVASFLLLCAMSGGSAFADTSGQIFVGPNTEATDYTVGEMTGITGGQQGAVSNHYSYQNVNLNGTSQLYKGNQAVDAGGGIYNGAYKISQTVNVNGNSTFETNTANRGGAIYNEGTVNFNGNTSFIGNTSTSAVDSDNHFFGGGAIVNFDGDISFKDDATVSFKNNTAVGDGGAILNLQTRPGGTPVIDLSNVNSIFSGNRVTGGIGGAIYSGADSIVNIGDATFSGNSDKNGANDIYLDGNAALNTSGTVSVGSGIAGSENASIVNSGDLTLAAGSQNANYKGSYTQTAGSTVVNGTFFGGENNSIEGGRLVVNSDNAIDDSKVNIGNSGSLIINSAANFTGNITGDGNITLGNSAELLLKGDNSAFVGDFVLENGTLTIGDGESVSKAFSGTYDIKNGDVVVKNNSILASEDFKLSGGDLTLGVGSIFASKTTISDGVIDVSNVDENDNGVKLAGQNVIEDGGSIKIGDFTDTSELVDNKITLNSDTAKLELFSKEGNSKNLDVNFNVEGKGVVLHSGEGALNLNNAGQNDLFSKFDGTFRQESASLGTDKKLITNVFGKFFKNSEIKNGTLNLKNGAELVEGSTTEIASGANLNIGTIADDTTVNPEKFDDNSTVSIKGNITGNGDVDVSQGKVTIAATSNNSAFEGSYHQTGGTVVAESGSTFFGSVNNLIEHGKLLFKQGAKLAEGKDVELSGNQYLSSGDLKTPVLDLDGRTNARFDGSNKLVLEDEQESNEGFVFTNGILENAILHGVQNIVGNGVGDDDKDAVITLRTGSGLASDAEASVSNGAELVFGTGSVAEKGSKIDVKEDGELILVSQNLDWNTIATGDGSIAVMKDDRETGSPNINIYGDQSGFKGNFVQAAGRVTVKSGSTFFGAEHNEITGFIDVDDNDPNKIIKETSGDLYLEKGSLLGSNITVTNADKTENAGVSTPHGRVFVEDKIFTQDGSELTNIDDLINQNNLYYNNILKADGTVDVDSLKQININNGGLILSNGTIFETPSGTAVFERKENGIIDIGFSNNTGVNGDILLKRDTMLSYGDNAFIKDDSTLTMEDTAILNFINDNAVVNYNPTIVGGGSIYKEGLAATNISSAIDMTGEVNVKEGTLNFTNKDKVIFKKGDDLRLRQTGNLTVGSNSANANLSIVAKETQFDGNVVANAQEGTQSGLYLLGKNTNIGGNLDVNNTITSITGNTSIGGNWNIDGNSSLNLIGNYANTIDVAGDLILGENLKDGKLPIAFDYDPHSNKMDTIIVDSFINDKNSPLLITGINFVTSPADRTFSLDADRLIQQRNPQDEPYYDPTAFYANTAMGRYYLTNGSAGGPNLTGSLVYLNPQQYRGQVATIASWQNQLVVNNMLFDHMDVITRQLMDDQKTANKYASAQPQFAPYQYDLKGGSLWYKAYGNFERLSMTRGLSVGNNAYGSLIGADFPLIKLKNGWNLVPTAYIGYNGAHQHFRGVSMYQNGAQLGLMGTAYKGNFITSLLAYGGGYGNDMSMSGEFGSGSDNTGNWFAGVASKTAYNIHLPADFIFQPTIMAAYNAFGSQNWGSDFGVLSMSSGMLNGINVAPGFNLIWQKKTFNIYATAQMVYNIMGGVDGRAGNIDLGYVRMRHSYFEYGLGVSKTFKDRFNGFLQFTIRNGGRTGIGFTGGLQIKVGK